MLDSRGNSFYSDDIQTGLVARFLDRYHAAPDGIVAECAEAALTMADLGHRAANLAGQLGASDAANAVVGVFAYPGFDLLSGLWGVLLSGSAYCPLSPDYPEDRLRYMIESAQMTTIICEAGLEEKLRDIAGAGVSILTAGAVQGQAALKVPTAPARAVSGDDLAYVIFTSGSTGRPKGVMIEHRNIAHQMDWVHAAFDIGAGTTILQKTPFSFDAAQWELLASAYGARLIFGTREGYRNPFEQIRLVTTFGVTMLQCVPTLWRALLETERLARCTTLTKLFSGGEALSRELARDCLQALPGADLVNLYGPTECTINATAFTVTQDWLRQGHHTVPIGRPVTGTEIVILDENGAPVLAGESGELYIGGAQIGRGYLGNPAATAERFAALGGGAGPRYYRTGDTGRQNADGSIQFLSRVDGQIKLRGYRIELDEIRTAIENHDWVKAAGVFVEKNASTGSDALFCCVELSPNQAQLMDASDAEDHHRSKSSKLQVKAQISGMGLRQPEELASQVGIWLPGRAARTAQIERAFARKSYRHFEGSNRVSKQDIAALLSRPIAAPTGPSLARLTLAELGDLMRNFGQFSSPERLLPKYAYASPGALYATQIYLALSNVAGLSNGIYYYHPVEHALYRIAPLPPSVTPMLRLHFVGKSRAIAHVYRLNIREVLDFEVGHILGLFDAVLPELGLAVGAPCDDEAILQMTGAGPEDYYLGGFSIACQADDAWQGPKVVPYVQAHGGGVSGLADGLYEHGAGGFRQVSRSVIERNHVIAINQQVYARAAFGVALCTPGVEGRLGYIALGRALQRLQMNDQRLGFMSSGYSSNSGEDQRAATRFFDLLGDRRGTMYFCVGGRISAVQSTHRGMKEDVVHSKGPLELIESDLKAQLPDYMVPNHIVLVDKIPMSANGKLDLAAAKALVNTSALSSRSALVAPRDGIEREIARHWARVIGSDRVSVTETFFEAGGDSLGAVKLVMEINKAFAVDLPLETIFEAATIEALARCIGTERSARSGRLVPLSAGAGAPVFCWPGLGGYPMGLRGLAHQLSALGRPVYGVQAYGLNTAETPDLTVTEMAARDVAEIRKSQPHGPYTLIGYSFGARVAFETTFQLEAAGEVVENLILVAPGSPTLRYDGRPIANRQPSFDNPDYVAVLVSVFTRMLGGPELYDCLQTVRSRDDFVAFAKGLAQDIPPEVVQRITEVAITCLDTTYRPQELVGHGVQAPMTVLKAAGDAASFVEDRRFLSKWSPNFCELPCDHYRLLMPDGVDMLGRQILSQLNFHTQFFHAA